MSMFKFLLFLGTQIGAKWIDHSNNSNNKGQSKKSGPSLDLYLGTWILKSCATEVFSWSNQALTLTCHERTAQRRSSSPAPTDTSSSLTCSSNTSRTSWLPERRTEPRPCTWPPAKATSRSSRRWPRGWAGLNWGQWGQARQSWVPATKKSLKF